MRPARNFGTISPQENVHHRRSRHLWARPFPSITICLMIRHMRETVLPIGLAFLCIQGAENAGNQSGQKIRRRDGTRSYIKWHPSAAWLWTAKSFFYVNPLESLPEDTLKDERKFHVKPVRQKWFGCACCPPILQDCSAPLHLMPIRKRRDSLYVHLYMGSVLERTAAVKAESANYFRLPLGR